MYQPKRPNSSVIWRSPFAMPSFRSPGAEAVFPVAGCGARGVHAVLTSLIQKILYRENGISCNGTQADADEIPADAGSVRVHITAHFILALGSGMLIPAKGCIIVMGSGIADTVPGVKLMGRKELSPSPSKPNCRTFMPG